MLTFTDETCPVCGGIHIVPAGRNRRLGHDKCLKCREEEEQNQNSSEHQQKGGA